MSRTHKKGVQISKVEIDVDNMVSVYSDANERIKLTRAQRITLCDYKSPDYIENIIKCFQNPNIIGDDFHVIKNGTLVYTENK